jgi:hypothetical protein
MRRGDALGQALQPVLVHQETDGAAVHAVDLLAAAHRLAQRLQQEAVAAQCDDNICPVMRYLAIALGEPLGRGIRLRGA